MSSRRRRRTTHPETSTDSGAESDSEASSSASSDAPLTEDEPHLDDEHDERRREAEVGDSEGEYILRLQLVRAAYEKALENVQRQVTVEVFRASLPAVLRERDDFVNDLHLRFLSNFQLNCQVGCHLSVCVCVCVCYVSVFTFCLLLPLGRTNVSSCAVLTS
jgi:hypothetical protein